jgi:DNA-binding response OmpR family regulator
MITDTLIKFEKELTQKKESHAKAIHILWVDDEVEFLRPHILYLTQNGYVVNTANNGLDALHEITEQNYDVVFMDENMPGLSGIETIARIKEINDKIPVVMITKNESERIMKEALKGNVADYLVKPVSLTQIFACVHKILNNRKSF